MRSEAEQAAARADVEKTQSRETLAAEHLLQRHHSGLDALLRHGLEEPAPVLAELEALAASDLRGMGVGGVTASGVGRVGQCACRHDDDVLVERSHCIAISTGQSRSA